MFSADAWTTPSRSPQYYPDAVTLDRAVTVDEVLARVDAGPGCSVKDSFATLDLAPHGFDVLFEAEWIERPAGAEPPPPAHEARWRRVDDRRELQAWEAAWAGASGSRSIFRPALLDHPEVAVLAGRARELVVAGAVLNRAAGAVGLTNVFARDGDLRGAWSAAVAAAVELFPNDSIVGYESGDDLGLAHHNAFRHSVCCASGCARRTRDATVSALAATMSSTTP